MKRETITISMPASMKQYIDMRSDSGGFGSVSDYFRSLIRLDQSRVYGRMGNDALQEMRRKQQMEATPGIFSKKLPSRVK